MNFAQLAKERKARERKAKKEGNLITTQPKRLSNKTTVFETKLKEFYQATKGLTDVEKLAYAKDITEDPSEVLKLLNYEEQEAFEGKGKKLGKGKGKRKVKMSSSVDFQIIDDGASTEQDETKEAEEAEGKRLAEQRRKKQKEERDARAKKKAEEEAKKAEDKEREARHQKRDKTKSKEVVKKKRGKTGYMLYAAEVRPQITEQFKAKLQPGEKLQQKTVMTAIGELWSKEDDGTKKLWKEKASALKEGKSLTEEMENLKVSDVRARTPSPPSQDKKKEEWFEVDSQEVEDLPFSQEYEIMSNDSDQDLY
jgi:hypothetical protein